jgi:hypothetical protein
MAKKTKQKPKKKPSKNKRKSVKRVRDYTGRFVKKGTAVKRKYYRPYKPSKKSNYSKFRSSLSKYIKDNSIKLGQLDERSALQNYNELASSIWNENRGLSLSTTKSEIPVLVTDYVERKSNRKIEKPYISESLTDPKIYFDIQFEVWGDFVAHPYFYVTSCSIMPKGVEIKLDGSLDESKELLADTYEKAFKHWVDWCNAYHYKKQINNESDKVEIYYAFAEDCTWNAQKHRWEIEIFSCRKVFDEKLNKYVAVFDDFGYIPPDYEPKPCEEKPESVGFKEKPVEIIKEPAKTDIDKEIQKVEKELQLTNKKIELLDRVDNLIKQGWTKAEILKLLGNA